MTAEPVVVDTAPTAVYRLFDSSRVLLYVGITDAPKTRWRSHAKRKSWWGDVTEKTIVWHPTRESAAAEEDAAIINEVPLYNVVGKPRVKKPPRESKPRDWRPWEATRTEKQRALRVNEADWNDYTAICEHEQVGRNADINAFIRRRIKTFRRKHPDVSLPSDNNT